MGRCQFGKKAFWYFLGSLATTLDGPSRDSQDIWDRLNVLLGESPLANIPKGI